MRIVQTCSLVLAQGGAQTMPDITVEDILTQIAKLPPTEQIRLRHLLAQPQQQPQQPSKPPQDRRVPPMPVPDSRREVQWLAAHAREYAGQWVALDGDRLIAHGPQHHEVWAAAEASGVYLPLVAFVENPDSIYAGF
jgi:hypothetical protein